MYDMIIFQKITMVSRKTRHNTVPTIYTEWGSPSCKNKSEYSSCLRNGSTIKQKSRVKLPKVQLTFGSFTVVYLFRTVSMLTMKVYETPNGGTPS